MQRLRPWGCIVECGDDAQRVDSCPIIADRVTGIPASPLGVESSRDSGAPHGLIEAEGHYSCLDFYFSVPAGWFEVNPLMRIVATSGAMTQELDARRLQDVELLDVDRNQAGTPLRANGLLFSIRGKPYDKIRVEAYPGEEALGLALFYARAWHGNGFYGDRNTRPVVDLWAKHNQQVVFTTAALADANPGVIAPNPNGGRIGITGLDWSTSGPAVTLTVEQEVPGAGASALLTYQGSDDVHRAFSQPVYTERGAQLNVSAPGVGAENAFNLIAFYE